MEGRSRRSLKEEKGRGCVEAGVARDESVGRDRREDWERLSVSPKRDMDRAAVGREGGEEGGRGVEMDRVGGTG